MTLQSYLSSGAVEDVRKLLAAVPMHGDLRTLPTDNSLWHARPARAWMRIEQIWRTEDGRIAIQNCYYREQSGSYIVSDCGETVSEVMRRTGKTWEESLYFVRAAINGDVPCCPDLRWRAIPSDRLAAYIVSVLGAVAKVRNALDKDGGR